ncbi:MAG: winged helix-turn-helix transcriptional regulator [Chloroflexi bacterium]|nr:MAG: winged helix-turn-helix transcriptional regulator [Chloroflexota bacterium]
MYVFAMTVELEAATDDDPLLPEHTWPLTPKRLPIYAAVHGAFHRLDQRLEFAARDTMGLSATDAVVLYSALTNPEQGVFVLRARTGLRASTLNSVLNRLERKRLLARARESEDRRYSEVRLTPEGHGYAEVAHAAIRELDEELAVWLPARHREAISSLFEAAAALPGPGRRADY